MIQLATTSIPATVTMEAITDTTESGMIREVLARFELNSAWLQTHTSEVFAHRGKFIAIAGQELFVGDTIRDVVAQANAAHPEDSGLLTRYIPMERGPRIYTN